MEILLGSDPELFVYEKGIPISAHGMVEGTKEAPLRVKNGAVQVDGMALEYNTDPASTLEEWENNHISVQNQLRSMMRNGHVLEATPTAFFSEEEFNNAPKAALELGCEPDYNAYTGMVTPKPDARVKFRTGAGHIHIGWTKDADIEDPFHIEECRALVKSLDFYIGVPSILMDRDVERRTLYGEAGCYRPKPYGLEYRTLSNFWTKTRDLRAWAYQNTLLGIEKATDPAEWLPNSRRVIQEDDLNSARYYCRDWSIPHVL